MQQTYSVNLIRSKTIDSFIDTLNTINGVESVRIDDLAQYTTVPSGVVYVADNVQWKAQYHDDLSLKWMRLNEDYSDCKQHPDKSQI